MNPQAFSLFNCQSANDDVKYLKDQLSLECFTDEWYGSLPWGIIGAA